jgi:hypothetical protein
MAAAWIWSSRTWILFDFNAHGMDLDAQPRIIDLWARVVDQISHPRMLFGNPEKLARPKTMSKPFFKSFVRLPPRRRPSFQKIGWPANLPLMSIKMELKRPLVHKFIDFVLHGLDPIACFLDLNGFGWPLHGFGDPGHGFYSISMLTAWI